MTSSEKTVYKGTSKKKQENAQAYNVYLCLLMNLGRKFLKLNLHFRTWRVEDGQNRITQELPDSRSYKITLGKYLMKN